MGRVREKDVLNAVLIRAGVGLIVLEDRIAVLKEPDEVLVAKLEPADLGANLLLGHRIIADDLQLLAVIRKLFGELVVLLPEPIEHPRTVRLELRDGIGKGLVQDGHRLRRKLDAAARVSPLAKGHVLRAFERLIVAQPPKESGNRGILRRQLLLAAGA